ALQRRVDRLAFAEGTLAGVLGLDALHPDAAAENGSHIAIGAREGLRLFHVVADAGEALEVLLDVGSRLFAGDAKITRETKGADAVDDAEIDGFGVVAYILRHAFYGDAEHFRRGARVNVDAVGEGLLQLRNIRDMCEQAQLNLRIVGGDQTVALLRNKRLADTAALLRPDRNVLQVRVIGGETTRCTCRQRVRRVDALRLGIDRRLQRFRVGGAQL